MCVDQCNNKKKNISSQGNIVQPQQFPNDNKTLWTHHEIKRKQRTVHEPTSMEVEMPISLTHYLKEEPILLNCDPLIYWRKHICPVLRQVAYRYLSIVATSMPSKRMFSLANNILTEKRNKLSPEHLDQLLFLSSLPMTDWSIEE